MDGVSGPGVTSFRLIPLEREFLTLFRGLENGQLLTGTVGRATPQGYIINFSGRQIFLETKASLEPGQQVRAEVVEHNGTFYLRLVQADGTGARSAASTGASLEQQVVALLEQVGLEATRENAAAARTLLLAGLPTSRGLIESLALVLSGRVALEAHLVQVTQMLRNVLARVTDSALLDQLNEIVAALENAIGAPAESDLAQKLRSFLANSGIFTEAKMKILLRSGATPSHAREAIAGDLKFVLLRLNSLLRDRAREFQQSWGTAALKELQTQVGQALKMVRGQQAQNLAQMEFHTALFQIPFLNAWGLDQVSIRLVYGDGGSEADRARPVAIVVTMNTTNMGRLRAVLQLQRHLLSCHFTAERESVAQLIRAESGLLKERFEALRFSVGSVTCGVGSCEENWGYRSSSAPLFERVVDVKA